MSTYESSYKSLLQGVSQQIPKERLSGQLTAQLNMLSDPVTNLRRRPGLQVQHHMTWAEEAETGNAGVIGWFTDIAGQRVHVLLNTATGDINLLDESYSTLATLAGGSYLTAIDKKDIRATTVGNEFFLCNTSIAPSVGGTISGTDASKGGFFYIVSGSYSRQYTVTIQDSTGSQSFTYTTPSGTGAGDSNLATPDYIATQLTASINAFAPTRWVAYRVSAYVYVKCVGSTDSLVIQTSTGSAYIVASRDGYVTQAGNLPAQLPVEADGFICKVGSPDQPQYYKYNNTQTAWLETGAPGSPSSITGVPVSIAYISDVWTLQTTAFEGRLAGDDTTNPDPHFLDYGITGMGTFQGRLVLLAGPFVSLSASNKPRRFYRSTVSSIVDSDCIHIGSSMNTSAAYEYATVFQKDLLLHSATYQALLPSGNQAITPRTATVVPTSGHAVDTSCSPVVIGRTLMFPAPRSEDFFGVMEMVPSPYTDSQYVSQDSTQHLPKYMGGRCRFAVASSVVNMALFSPSGDPRSLIVHEYMWDGDQKVQQAWHTWTFPYDVETAYFAADKVVIAFLQNEQLVLCSIDPKVGVLTFDAERRPFSDMWVPVDVVDRAVTVPAWMLEFDPDIKDKLVLAVLTGALAGEAIGFTSTDTGLQTVRSFTDGQAALGIPYRSGFSPTQPVVRDFNEVAISTNKATLLRYLLGTKNSSEFQVQVYDSNSPSQDPFDVGTLNWSSQELETERGRFSTDAVCIIPCRTNMGTTTVFIYTDGLGELNATALEYVARYNQKIRRR